MRICVATFAAPEHGRGGLQDIVKETVEELALRGHRVDVVTARHPDFSRTLTRQDDDGLRWHFMSSDARNPPTAPKKNPDLLRETAEYIADLNVDARFDVILSESESALAAIGHPKLTQLPIVTRFHGNYVGEVLNTARTLGSDFSRVTLRKAAGRILWTTRDRFAHRASFLGWRNTVPVVVSQQQIRNTRITYNLWGKRIHVVPNGIDLGSFAPAAKARETGPPVALVLGRLEFDKGVDDAICAMQHLDDLDLHLRIVGDGRARPYLEQLARRLGVSHRVTFVGAIPASDVPDEMRRASLFLFPTRRDEAAPLTAIQALACGLPVIGSRRGSLPEVLDRPDVNGILVDACQPEQLAIAARRVISDPALASVLSRGGRSRVETRYSRTAMVDGLEGVFETATSARRQLQNTP